jgi:threonine dehydratase
VLLSQPSKADIISAHSRIQSYINRTPVLTSQTLNTLFGASLFFKCENFQKAGAFKSRGAVNVVFLLEQEIAEFGVCTHSSGNHAQALARAAKIRGIPSHIVMPSNAPKVKISAVEEYGGIITFCEPNLKAREDTLKKVQEETGAFEVHPYDNYDIIAAQATTARELIDDSENNLDILLCPVGGGGLLSGTALAADYFSKGTKVIACEPKGADDAYHSFRKGELIPSVNPNTIADGLLTSLGKRNFPIIKEYVNNIVTVSEENIVNAMRLIYERMKIIIEPSSAVPLAAILENKVDVRNKKIGIILSGGNIDLNELPFGKEKT